MNERKLQVYVDQEQRKAPSETSADPGMGSKRAATTKLPPARRWAGKLNEYPLTTFFHFSFENRAKTCEIMV